MEIILASQSPRRKELLKKIGFTFKVIPSSFDESTVPYKQNPEAYCKLLSVKKAEEVAGRTSSGLIISADTIVVLKNELYPKPENIRESIKFLKNLSGSTHQVYTGVSILSKHAGIHHSFVEKTDVSFYALSTSEITHYVMDEIPLDKAGGYGIQDFSSVFVEKIDGCYFNVVGLPISRFYRELKNIYPDLIENLLVTKKESL